MNPFPLVLAVYTQSVKHFKMQKIQPFRTLLNYYVRGIRFLVNQHLRRADYKRISFATKGVTAVQKKMLLL